MATVRFALLLDDEAGRWVDHHGNKRAGSPVWVKFMSDGTVQWETPSSRTGGASGTYQTAPVPLPPEVVRSRDDDLRRKRSMPGRDVQQRRGGR